MSIFADIIAPPPPPPPPDPALEARKTAALAEANRLLRTGFTAMVAAHNGLVNLVNHSPFDLTPQQTADALGPGGGMLLAFAAKVQELVGLVAASQGVSAEQAAALLSKPKAGHSYGIGANGELTVTVSE